MPFGVNVCSPVPVKINVPVVCVQVPESVTFPVTETSPLKVVTPLFVRGPVMKSGVFVTEEVPVLEKFVSPVRLIVLSVGKSRSPSTFIVFAVAERLLPDLMVPVRLITVPVVFVPVKRIVEDSRFSRLIVFAVFIVVVPTTFVSETDMSPVVVNLRSVV